MRKYRARIISTVKSIVLVTVVSGCYPAKPGERVPSRNGMVTRGEAVILMPLRNETHCDD